MRKSFIVLILMVVSVAATAKITTYTNEEVMSKILTSKDLETFKSKEKELKGFSFTMGLLENTGGTGIGGTYNLDLFYTQAGKSEEEGCHFRASVTNEKTPGTPAGITASGLEKITFSKVTCGTAE